MKLRVEKNISYFCYQLFLTERYQSSNLEDLQKELEKCHPSGK